MSKLRIQILAGILAVQSIPHAYASQCTQDIHETMIAVANRLATIASQGRPSPETRYATMHRQPTPMTVVQAEAQLGALPPTAIIAFDESMQRAAEADNANDLPSCRQALTDAQQALAQTRQSR
jgi:hypothetical protein